jgi:hypothetical protein
MKRLNFFLVFLLSWLGLCLYGQESLILEGTIGASGQAGVLDVNGNHYARWQDLKSSLCNS